MGMVERSFADVEYESKKHKTGRELFLERMEELIRWDQLVEAIKPYYPQSGKGRVPYPLESILRLHCILPVSVATRCRTREPFSTSVI